MSILYTQFLKRYTITTISFIYSRTILFTQFKNIFLRQYVLYTFWFFSDNSISDEQELHYDPYEGVDLSIENTSLENTTNNPIQHPLNEYYLGNHE